LNVRSIPAYRRMAFVATLDNKNQLWVRDLDSLAACPLPATDGADHPFWSPDCRFVAFFAGGKLKKIDVAGVPAVSLCDAAIGRTGYGGSWSKNDVILFSPANNMGLFRVPAPS
jgi:eukaryotic-like serine/threonine-protein kinase